MKCFYCDEDVLWQNDFDAEDVNPDSSYTIISYYDCKNCGAWYEVYQNPKEENDTQRTI